MHLIKKWKWLFSKFIHHPSKFHINCSRARQDNLFATNMKLWTRKSPISLREGRPRLFPSCLKQQAGGQAVDWGPFNAFCNVLSAEMSITMIMMMCPPSLLTEDAQRQQDLKELCKPASSSLRGPAARTLASSQPPAERGWRILQNLNLEFLFSGECHICLEYLINQLGRVESWLNTFSPEQRD